jgi:hypothetical protein
MIKLTVHKIKMYRCPLLKTYECDTKWQEENEKQVNTINL